MVVLVNGLPVAQNLGAVGAVGRGVQHQMKVLGDGANADEGAAQQGCKVEQDGAAAEGEALKRGLVAAGQDPGLVGDAGSVGAKRGVVAAHFDHAHALAFLLRQDVAEHAALLLHEVVAPGAQFVEHAAGDEGGGGQLRAGMLEFLSGHGPVILKDADVLEAAVALEVVDALAGQQQELLDFGVARVPQLAVVADILDQHLVRPH